MKGLQLQFKNVDKGTSLILDLKEGLNELSVPVGHWELTGFGLAGKSYLSMNTSKKFVFRMKEKVNIYSGSIVVGCPQVGSKDLKYLKEMKFFNRYPFSSTQGLCEMVVGDNSAQVRAELKKDPKSNNLKLIMGF